MPLRRADVSPANFYWSTAEAEAGRALDYWSEVIGAMVMQLQIETPVGESFHGLLQQRDLGPVRLSFLHSSQQFIRRTRYSIARSTQATFNLVHLRQGRVVVGQYGRTLELTQGECCLMDSAETFEFHTAGPCECLVAHLPQKWLMTRLPNPHQGIARRWPAGSAWGAVLAGTMAAIRLEDLESLAVPPEALADQIAGLLALTVGPGGHCPTQHRRKLLLKIKRTLLDRAHESTLEPAGVANEYRISKRYLHSLFASEGTTFCEELIRIRLERALHLLRDPRYANISIADIAWSCGFADPSHFARRFRKFYGAAPGGYRAQGAAHPV